MQPGLLAHHHVERRIRQGQGSGVTMDEVDQMIELDAHGQAARGLDTALREIHARHTATLCRRARPAHRRRQPRHSDPGRNP